MRQRIGVSGDISVAAAAPSGALACWRRMKTVACVSVNTTLAHGGRRHEGNHEEEAMARYNVLRRAAARARRHRGAQRKIKSVAA